MNQLRFATLNFSGVNTSPFEYHNGSKQKNHLNSIFQTLLNEYNLLHPGIKWDIGKLDKIFSRERYSILYRADCGFIRKRLVTKNQFEAIWDRTFDQNQGIVGHMDLPDELVDKLRVFDWMVYKAFVISVFGEVNLEDTQNLSVDKYKEELKKWHSQSFLNEDKKIDNVRNYIANNDIDVMFLQEALPRKMIDLLPSDDYNYVKNEDSMIIYKKEEFFLEDKTEQFHEKYKDKLNFNKDSVYLKSKNFLLVSVHLTSKSNNVEQAKGMLDLLNEIQQQYPQLIIVVGADANHDIVKAYNFHSYPDNHLATTRKKRTHMQCQFSKSGKLVEQTKDVIISNRQIDFWKISSIKETDPSDELLPNDNHPYDHFVVFSTLPFERSNFPKLSRENFSTIEIRIDESHTLERTAYVRADTYESFSKIKPPSDHVFTRRRTFGEQNNFQPIQMSKIISALELSFIPDKEKNRKSSFDFQ